MPYKEIHFLIMFLEDVYISYNSMDCSRLQTGPIPNLDNGIPSVLLVLLSNYLPSFLVAHGGTTFISPSLYCGCISKEIFYHELIVICAEHGEPTHFLMGG